MAKISLCLSRSRNYTADSFHSLNLSFSAEGKTYYLQTGIKLKQRQWDQRRLVVVRHPNADKLTVEASKMLLRAREAVLRVFGSYSADGVDAEQVRDAVQNELNGNTTTRFLLPYMEQFMKTRPKPNTRSVYKSTISRLSQYNPAMRSVLFDNINPSWLRGFDKWLSENGCPSVNARAVHFRNIRAVFNAAIDDGLTRNYPFRRFKISHERKAPKHLSVRQLRKLITLELDGREKHARDCFLLSFYLLGINMADLWRLLDPQQSKVRYNRQKTGRTYEFRLQPEASRLWPVLEWVRTYLNPHTFVCAINRLLKNVGKLIGVPRLTTYWARYSWATIAASLDIPKETIAAALGHSQHTVTDVYIAFDHSKIDKANRKVIDHVLGLDG